jgi:transcriptional regulator with XRE-family HTH domain
MGSPRVSVRARRVAAELRRLREELGMSHQDVAVRLGVPASRISRLETAAGGLPVADVEALLRLYRVPERERTDVFDALRRCDEQDWWARLRRPPRHWRTQIHLEASAARVCDFQLRLVPGALRTDEYNSYLLAASFLPRSAAETANLVTLQRSRQALLTRSDGPRLCAIVDEHAFRCSDGRADMMRAQLRHILAATELPHVTFQVIPDSVGLHAGMHGGFTMTRFERDVDVVFAEQMVSAMFFESQNHVSTYRDILTSLGRDALSPESTRDFLAGLLAKY